MAKNIVGYTNSIIEDIFDYSEVAWGHVTGDIKDQEDLTKELNNKQETLSEKNAGANISITTDSEGNKLINSIHATAVWGNITGNIDEQADLKEALNKRQEDLSLSVIDGKICMTFEREEV